jgi:hypothetical protein
MPDRRTVAQRTVRHALRALRKRLLHKGRASAGDVCFRPEPVIEARAPSTSERPMAGTRIDADRWR